MITHEQVKIAVRKLHITALEDNEIVKDAIDDDLALTLNYITQQEKVSKLLELYHKVLNKPCETSEELLTWIEQIKTIEEELK
jgi:hypothetical protein